MKMWKKLMILASFAILLAVITTMLDSGVFGQVRPPNHMSATRPTTLTEMIEAGHYQFVDPEIAKINLSVKPELFTTSGLRQVQFDSSMSTGEILNSLPHNNFRPATVEQLLAFGAANPEEQRKHAVVALASSFKAPDGESYVFCLVSDGSKRGLVLFWSGYEWNENYRFLASIERINTGFLRPP